MKILLSNDDGIKAPGIALLEEIVKQLTDDYVIVAPENHKSGAGHSITIENALVMKKYDDTHFSVNGSPADCVTFAFSQICKEKHPDIVLSGINFDRNYGSDVTSSGTVAVAMEGVIQGARSISLSQRMSSKEDKQYGFEAVKKYGLEVLKQLIPITSSLAKNAFLNVNFPACKAEDVKGMKIARQAIYNKPRAIKGPFECPFGFNYFWQSDPVSDDNYPEDSDIFLCHNNYITVTPLSINLTHDSSFEMLRHIEW